jgi:AP-2 complex subunit mu-1
MTADRASQTCNGLPSCFRDQVLIYSSFRIQVISNAQVRSPILTLGSTTFSHVKHENIYLVAITKSNANAALVFEFLYRLVALGKGYFGKFDEEAVKNNFVLVYELLDGMSSFVCHLQKERIC